MVAVCKSRYNEPATGRQLHLLSILLDKAGIKEPIEEQGLTFGEAGKMIRKFSVNKYKKGVKNGK